MSEEQSAVTKQKNPGRVAAGKRLVEYNRKTKEELLKNKNQVKSSDESSEQELSSGTVSSTVSSTALSTGLWYGGSTAIILGVGIAAFFLYTHRAPPMTEPSKNYLAAAPAPSRAAGDSGDAGDQHENNDIFRMN